MIVRPRFFWTAVATIALTAGALVAPGSSSARTTLRINSANAETSNASSTSWPQFQYNPRHTGYNSAETTISPSNVCRLRAAWRNPVGGTRPAVVGGVVYSTSNSDLSALDAATGSLLWTVPDLAGTTPAVANGLVYVQNNDGFVRAVRADTGAPVWSTQTQGGESSPTVANGRVYVGGYFAVYALDAATGAPDWVEPVGSVIRSSPAVTRTHVYVSVENGNVVALDAATGAKVWKTKVGSLQSSSPAVLNGVVYVGTLLSGTAFALSARTGTVLWSATVPGGVLDSSPAVAYGTMYISDYANNELWAFDTSTGKVRWGAPGPGSQGSAAVANGVVYAAGNDSKLYAINASTGAVLWARTGYSDSPAVVAGRVYSGSAAFSLQGAAC